MKKRFPIYFLILFSLIGFITTVDAQDVSTWMPDDNLRTVVRTALNLEADEPLTQDQMLNLTWLYVPQRDITDLTGLEHATNLITLIIFRNQIVDIQPIGKLRKLIFLYVINNLITDISPLDQLTRLRFLALQQNQIRDVSALENSEELEWLYLAGNPITDTSPLMNLPKLRSTDIEIGTPEPPQTDEDTPQIEPKSEPNVKENTAPVFTDGDTTTRSVAENTLEGTEIGTPVAATDSDDDTLIYTLGGADATIFEVQSTTGQLKTKKTLDFETQSTYKVTLTVSDGKLSDSIEVTITVTDIDETVANSAPTFTEGSSATRSIAENTGSGVNIGSPVSATDADNDTLTYTFNGTDATAFSIDSTTGQLLTSAPLNYEAKSTYTVTITASDGNGGNSSINVNINISNVNEPPVFIDGDRTTRSIAENVDADINIGTAVTATDVDSDTLTYTLDGTDAAAFRIDSATGQLQTKAPLDYETKPIYFVRITVSDSSLIDTIAVTIKVTNLDETPSSNPPLFTEGTGTARTVAENTQIGGNVGLPISATDIDNNVLTYLLSGPDSAAFSIDSTTGQLKVNTALDYETRRTYMVVVTVSDGSFTKSINVRINVTNVNEAPVFTAGDSIVLSVAENTSAGVNIGSAVSATDPDGDDLTWTLGGTDASSFSIVNTSGQLKTSAALDFETKSSYTVTVLVSDGNGGSDSITVTINVTDVDENRVPVFSQNSLTRDITISTSTAAGDSIGDPITATDADNDTLTYTLGGTDADKFDIGSSSGQLQVTDALLSDTGRTYSITVIASDDNGGSGSVSVTVNVIRPTPQTTNNAPVFTDGATTTRSVAENTASGQDIGSAVSATDADNDTLAYTLGGTDAGSFSIVSTSGQLKTSAALDYETKNSYSVTVSVSDGNGGSGSITVTINVTDVNENRAPAFSENSLTRAITISTTTVAGDNIGDPITATDADDDTLTYTLGGTDAAMFGIDSSSGQLQVTDALLSDTGSSYSITVIASDDNSGSGSVSVTVNVIRPTPQTTNNAPVFTDGETTTRSIAENTASGQDIGTAVSATDADNDTLTYTLGGTDADSFSIVGTSGQLQTSAALDYETKSSYSVTVSVSDSNGGTDTINVTINITNVVNEAQQAAGFNLLMVSSPWSIKPGGSEQFTVYADNADDGSDAADETVTFSVSPDDGTVSLSTTSATTDSDGAASTWLRTTSNSSGTYTVTATFDNDQSISSTAIIVAQQQVSNNAPVFSDGTTTTRSVAENTASGQNIGTAVSATDADDDTLTYTLGGTDASSFSIVSTTGQLQTSAALDYEDKFSYSVTVKVTDDSGASNASATIAVTINVNDINDAPTFNYGDSVTLSVNKGERLGTSIRATDDDGDELSYTLGGTDVTLFSLSEDYEYYLKSNAPLDYDGKTSYSVTITVSDDNGGSNTITVTITDPAPEVEIFTLVAYDEPNWVLELDTETGVVNARQDGLFATSLRDGNSKTFTRARGVKFRNTFTVSVEFSENNVSGFEQSDLTLTDNTAGASITYEQGPEEAWFGTVYSAEINVTMSGSVTFNVAAGVATDSVNQPNTAAESKTFTVTINLTDYPPWDVNKDGSVDETDLALVTAARGQTGDDIVDERTDVNWDGTVDAADVTLVNYHIEDEEEDNEGGAPSIIKAFSLLDKKALEKLDPGTLQDYLNILRSESDGSPRYLRAIAIVESVLAAIRPSKTQLLANYPNPFNPETWIPYQLSEPADVALTIYNSRGVVVRELKLGQKAAGIYQSRSRAIHWDGRNNIGEKVSTGVYFYTLTAGDFTATRRMLILK